MFVQMTVGNVTVKCGESAAQLDGRDGRWLAFTLETPEEQQRIEFPVAALPLLLSVLQAQEDFEGDVAAEDQAE